MRVRTIASSPMRSTEATSLRATSTTTTDGLLMATRSATALVFAWVRLSVVETVSMEIPRKPDAVDRELSSVQRIRMCS